MQSGKLVFESERTDYTLREAYRIGDLRNLRGAKMDLHPEYFDGPFATRG
jgi:hypothetical protein